MRGLYCYFSFQINLKRIVPEMKIYYDDHPLVKPKYWSSTGQLTIILVDYNLVLEIFIDILVQKKYTKLVVYTFYFYISR